MVPFYIYILKFVWLNACGMVPATHIFPMKVMSGECQKGGHKTFNESK